MSYRYPTAPLARRQPATVTDDPADLFRRLARATRDREYARAKLLMAELRRAGWSVVFLGDAREGRR